MFTYLKQAYRAINLEEKRRIITEVNQYPGIIKNQAGLKDFRFPEGLIVPILFIKELKIDRLKYRLYLYIAR